MMSRSAEEKPDWGKSWAANILLAKEIQEWMRGTPEERRINEIKGGVITSLAGVGLMIFLYFFLDLVAKRDGDSEEIVRSLWMVGIIPILVGIGLLIWRHSRKSRRKQQSQHRRRLRRFPPKRPII